MNPDKILSIIIPVYNERASIELLFNAVWNVPLRKEVIIVDDGSTDGSSAIIREKILESHPEVRYIKHPVNQGKGAAIQSGLRQVTGDWVIIQDADMEYNPMDYLKLLEPFNDPAVDVVYGSRFLANRKVTHIFHYAVNQFITVLGNVLYGKRLTDLETCYKVFRADQLKRLPIRSKGFELEAEITSLVFKAGLNIVEVPVSYHGRNYAQGKKITWRDGVNTVVLLIRMRMRSGPKAKNLETVHARQEE